MPDVMWRPVLHMQHTNLLLESIYNKSLSVRLGLLSPDHQSLLLVLPTQLGCKAGSKDASGKCQEGWSRS